MRYNQVFVHFIVFYLPQTDCGVQKSLLGPGRRQRRHKDAACNIKERGEEVDKRE